MQLPGDAAGEQVGADARGWGPVDPLPLVAELSGGHGGDRGQRVVEAGHSQDAGSMRTSAAGGDDIINIGIVASLAARRQLCHLPPGRAPPETGRGWAGPIGGYGSAVTSARFSREVEWYLWIASKYAIRELEENNLKLR